jgi:hypothetical protein
MVIMGGSRLCLGGAGGDAAREAEGAPIPTGTLINMVPRTHIYRLVVEGRVLQEGTVAEVCRAGDLLRVTFVGGGMHDVWGAPGVGFRGCAGEGGACMWD